MRSPSGPVLLLGAAGVLSCAIVVTGYANGGPAPAAQGSPHPAHAAPSPGASGPPASLARIAAALGCRAEVIVDAQELREGGCTTGAGTFRMLTFSSDAKKRAWLTEAQAYGGTYLVGTRWSVTGPSRSALAPLRAQLGGSVESGGGHGRSSRHDHAP
ncbi:hypothetical protein ADK70_29825 [Streptomyces rimosus subsp. pseudoverticillatus]|uniref:hypothetical protein n=1 Tax=Streptomyces rimosus TaxID=1927 RepID=UPI0006C4812D|nr:hypothetical protein [Streptomyces rimosus]KOT79742.1 hypothetical protein ADK70_29825 [Streptomyces rimosus subsp. pseudoverticillatus]